MTSKRPPRPEYEAPEFRRLWHSPMMLADMAAKYGVSIPSISRAAHRRGFKSKHAVHHEIREHAKLAAE